MPVKGQFTDVRRLADVVVLRPKRSLLGDVETEELDALLAGLDAEGVRFLVIDLTEVELVNSTGFSTVVKGHVRFSRRQARIHLCCLARKVESVYKIIRLGQMIPAFQTTEQALAAFPRKDV